MDLELGFNFLYLKDMVSKFSEDWFIPDVKQLDYENIWLSILNVVKDVFPMIIQKHGLGSSGLTLLKMLIK